jgi:tRNA U34 5-methylaminomethyl-2-thiouridine-forming methyltransferase MnmC
MTLTLHPTADGSLSLLDPETGELYHNSIGAITEALQHYTLPTQPLDVIARQNTLSLLDACFGLGYNTWVLLSFLIDHFSHHPPSTPPTITAIGIESNPQLASLFPKILNHPTLQPLKNFLAPSEHNIYYQTQPDAPFHFSNLNQNPNTTPIFLSLTIHWTDLRTAVQTLHTPVDRIFHDPFSPRKIPELWTLQLFQHYHRLLAPNHGRLLTYSSANAVRAGLSQAGFTVYKTTPLGRKTFGGTMGIVPTDSGLPLDPLPETIRPLTPEETAKLQGAAGIPYHDSPSLSLDRDTILSCRSEAQQAFQSS